MKRATTRLVMLAVAMAALAACGHPSGPVAVPPEDLPFTLRRSPEATPPAGLKARYSIYFVRDSRLVRVTRSIEGTPSPAEAVIRALFEGPSPRERARRIGTEIPPATRLLDVAVIDRIAAVDLSAEFQGPATSDSVLRRVAQVVWTLVALPDITAVRFAIDGETVAVLTDRGMPVERPVTSPDYASVAPGG